MFIRGSSRPSRRALLLLIGLFIGGTTLMVGSSSSEAADAPTLSLDPVEAPAGWPVAATGTGWIPNSAVSIFRDQTESRSPAAALAVVDSDPAGNFSTKLLAPSDSVAKQLFFACQDCNDPNATATAPFLIESPPTPTLFLDPSQARPGSTVSVTGTGWNPEFKTVSIFRDAADSALPTAALAEADPDGTGNILTTLVVPVDTAGDHVFFACQECNDPNATATARFTILPPLLKLVTVPNLVGLSVAQAQVVMHRRHLALQVSWVGSGDERGRVASQRPSAGTRVRRGSSVFVAARRTALVAVVPTGSTSWPRRAASGGILLLLAGAAAVLWWRPRRQRAWVRRHVRMEPRSGPAQVIAQQDLDDQPDHAVTLQVRHDRGTQTLEEVRS